MYTTDFRSRYLLSLALQLDGISTGMFFKVYYTKNHTTFWVEIGSLQSLEPSEEAESMISETSSDASDNTQKISTHCPDMLWFLKNN